MCIPPSATVDNDDVRAPSSFEQRLLLHMLLKRSRRDSFDQGSYDESRLVYAMYAL
jgi:hypothetical protein